MSRLRMAAGAACCFVALFSGQAAASGPAQCWQSYEMEAAKVRDLHIMLMLGSLKCKSANSEITNKYTTFIEKKNGQLRNYNTILKARFMRVNGITDGHHAFEEFNTKLGNSHSGSVQTASYCQTIDTLLTLAIGAGDQELPLLARNFSEDRLGVEDCEAAPTPLVADAATPAKAAAPVTVAKTEEAASSPPSAAAALEAAAAALQTAAASLKAQSTAPTMTETADQPASNPAPKPAVLRPIAAASGPVG